MNKLTYRAIQAVLGIISTLTPDDLETLIVAKQGAMKDLVKPPQPSGGFCRTTRLSSVKSAG